MEAFPTIFLISDDVVLAEAIPAQLKHALGTAIQHFSSYKNAEPELKRSPPGIMLLDILNEEDAPDIKAFRQNFPLIGLIAIGSRTISESQHELFDALPLAALSPRPLALEGLIRSIEHLTYERQITAGQQSLTLTDDALFLPHKKAIKQQDGSKIALTDKEVALLLCLYHHRMDRLPRQNLLEEVWGYSEGVATHTLETHIYRLRQKLKDATGNDSLIRTDQGTYQLITL